MTHILGKVMAYATLPLFLKLEFLKISDIYNIQISKFTHDCLNGYAPLQFNSWFNLNTTIHDHHTRSNVQLQMNNVKHIKSLYPFSKNNAPWKKIN